MRVITVRDLTTEIQQLSHPTDPAQTISKEQSIK